VLLQPCLLQLLLPGVCNVPHTPAHHAWQAGRQAGKQADRQADRQAGRQAARSQHRAAVVMEWSRVLWSWVHVFALHAGS
jgi:hypothetical protein